jgi:hypothetical protein
VRRRLGVLYVSFIGAGRRGAAGEVVNRPVVVHSFNAFNVQWFLEGNRGGGALSHEGKRRGRMTLHLACRRWPEGVAW